MSISAKTTVPLPPPVEAPDRGLSAVSDADLLDAWTKDQHRDALAALVQRYSVLVLSVCRRRCRTSSDVEDAFQTTFLLLAHNSGKIRRPERLPGWLHRVAQRAATASLKSSLRQENAMAEPADTDLDPLEQIARRHDAIALDEELADLPEHYRNPIVMHWYEGLSFQTIADRCGTTLGSVRGRIQRGKKLLAGRLRRRGIVPVLAITAGTASTVSSADAAEVAQDLMETTADALPQPPIDTSLVQPFLSPGAHLMPTVSSIAALIIAGSVFAYMLPVDADQPSVSRVLTITGEEENEELLTQLQANQPQGGGGPGVGGGGPGVTTAQPVPKPVKFGVPEPTSTIGMMVVDALDADDAIDLQVSGKLSEITSIMQQQLNLPVLIDENALPYANLTGDELIDFNRSGEPMLTTLYRLLNPHGLKAVAANEGLLITADLKQLALRGVNTSRWVSIDDEQTRKFTEQLQQPVSIEFKDFPLEELLVALGEKIDNKIRVDHRSLEEIGLTSEAPVSIDAENLPLIDVLSIVLRDLDLSVGIANSEIFVSTIEALEQDLQSRLYYLEGSGFDNGDFASVIEVVQVSVTPETWEALGGPSTIIPLMQPRPAILVSTTYSVHQRIEKLMDSLRASAVGPSLVPIPNDEQNEGPGQQGGFF